MIDQRMHRVGDLVLARDPQFANEGEWDLFRVERGSRKDTLAWQMTITESEMQNLLELIQAVKT